MLGSIRFPRLGRTPLDSADSALTLFWGQLPLIQGHRYWWVNSCALAMSRALSEVQEWVALWTATVNF